MVSKPKRGRRAATGKNLGGRPFLPDEDRRDTRIYVLTTASEHEELQGAAAHVGMPVSSWVRVSRWRGLGRSPPKKRQHVSATSSDRLAFVIEAKVLCWGC